VGWIESKFKKIIVRVRNFLLKKDKFSVRDVRLLRKLVHKQKKENYLDFDEIQYYFPGKSVESIKKKYYEQN